MNPHRAKRARKGVDSPGYAELTKDDRERRRHALFKQRRTLPVYSVRGEILQRVSECPTLIVVGETGSGKTTQIAQFLHEAGWAHKGMIGITQPRRVAAISVARRVAEEMGVELGAEVGYTIRFEDRTSQRTRVKYLTDGMLLRECLLDPLLKRYAVILLDEAHERSLHTDILFALVKGIQAKRSDLKVLVMSATLEAESFASYFNGAAVLKVEGRLHPVDIMYTQEPESDYVDAALISTLQIHLDEGPGGILVFLTGQEEIESLAKILEEKSRLLPPSKDKMLVCPIFATLPAEEQMKVFEPAPPACRKIILATNIAETSITINGIRFVIDTGVVKARAYHAKTGMECLQVVPISQASAQQRSGRAGREAPGKTFRLYTEPTFETLRPFTLPEIKRVNLSTVVLQLKALGVDDILNFDFMDKPPRSSLIKALELLYHLGALGKGGKLTTLGRLMAHFPVDPMYSKVLIVSKDFGCTQEMLSIVSMLSVESVFYTPAEKRDTANLARKKFASLDGDHLTLLNVYNAYVEMKGEARWCRQHFINMRTMRKVLDVRRQLQEYCQGVDIPLVSCGRDTAAIRRCLVTGFFVHVARIQLDGKFLNMVDHQEVNVHPSSILFQTKPECVIYDELVLTSKKYIRGVTVIELGWLVELAPHFYGRKHGDLSTDQRESKNTPSSSCW